MTANERLREIRTELNMSQEELGKKLGVTRAAISRIEAGDRKLTKQMCLAVCRELRVNYFYLTEGNGDRFTGMPTSVVEEIAEDYNLDEIDKKIIEKYLELDEAQRKVLKDYLKSIFA